LKDTALELKRMNMNVPKQLHDAFKAAAAARGEKMTEVVLTFIEDYVKKYGTPKTKGRR
jgi:predicted HicB family RNase H-like nuclease